MVQINTFTKYADAGFQAHVIPVIPPGAKLHKSSSLGPKDLGKIPGKQMSDGSWVGFIGWPKLEITPQEIQTFDAFEGASVGIRTGTVVGVDIDMMDAQLAEEIEELAQRCLGPAPRRIGSAPKRLLPYRTTTPTSKITIDFVHDETSIEQKLEVLGTGQHFLSEGIHPKTNKPYMWSGGSPIETGFNGLTEVAPGQVSEFLDEVKDLMAKAGYEVKSHQSNPSGNRTPIGDPSTMGDPELVRMALTLIGNDFDYSEWIGFVGAIKAALGGDMEYYEIYEDWCLLYDGNNPDIARQKWDSFSDAEIGFDYLIDRAKKVADEKNDCDFLEAYANYELQCASDEFQSDDDFKDAQEDASASSEADIQAILSPPGLVGEIAAYHDANSLRETPIFGVATGLATVSALAANNFVFMPNIGQPVSTNLYQMTVGATGLGKEHPRSVVKEALHVAGVSEMDVDAASEPALLRNLSEDPNGLWLKDEIGRHIEFAANPSGGHQFALITQLTSLYGLPFTSTSRRVYSDGKQTIPAIQNPYMTVFSTSTRESLATALNSFAVVDGTLNRFIVIHDPNVKPKFQDKPPTKMSGDLEWRIKKLYTDGGKAAVANEFMDDLGKDTTMTEIRDRYFITIKPGEGTMDLLMGFRNAADDSRAEGGLNAPLWARAYENALRVASVVTIGDSDLKHPVMTFEHARWAITFIRWAIGNSISLMDNVSDNEVERTSKKIENFVHEVIKNPAPEFKEHNLKGRVPKSQIIRRFRTVRSPELDQHLKTLCAAGLLSSEEIKTAGRSTIVFRPLG
jgi:hypothetical protein